MISEPRQQLATATAGNTKLAEQIAKLEEQKSNIQTLSQQRLTALEEDYRQVKSELDAMRESESFKTGAVRRDSLEIGGDGPVMVFIKGGPFKIGSPRNEADRNSNEDQQDVNVEDFYIGKYEVTFAEYDVFAERTNREKPSDAGWGRGDRPVINVTWYDAVAYADWLSKQTGEKYSLPTEAQWEYAAKAGKETPFFTGPCITTAEANYNGNYDYDNCGAKTGEYRRKTIPVSTLSANPWGLHHVAGNVWEWTCSEYSSKYDGRESVCINDLNSSAQRVTRGGSWSFEPPWVRSATRTRNTPDFRLSALGFRLARSK